MRTDAATALGEQKRAEKRILLQTQVRGTQYNLLGEATLFAWVLNSASDFVREKGVPSEPECSGNFWLDASFLDLKGLWSVALMVWWECAS